MGEIDDLEEIARQTNIRVNERDRRHPGRKEGTLGVSPGLARAHAAREKPVVFAQPAVSAPPPRRPPPPPEMLMVADHGQVIAVVRRHQDVTEVFRLMKERLGLTNAFIDDAGGLTGGHTDKILGPSESKSWGPTTFDLFCEMFAIEFHVHVDMAAVKRMEAVWEGRKRPAEYSETKRVSKKLIERAKPYVLKGMGEVANAKRNALLSGEQRIKIARKAARKSSRTSKLTPARRSEIARIAASARWPKPEIIAPACVPADLDAQAALPSPSRVLLSDQSQQ